MNWSDAVFGADSIPSRLVRALQTHLVLALCMLLVLQAMGAVRYWRASSLEYPWQAAVQRLAAGLAVLEAEAALSRQAAASGGLNQVMPSEANPARAIPSGVASSRVDILLADPGLAGLRASSAADFEPGTQFASLDEQWAPLRSEPAVPAPELAVLRAGADRVAALLAHELRSQEAVLLGLQAFGLLLALGLFGLAQRGMARLQDAEAGAGAAPAVPPGKRDLLEGLPGNALDLTLEVNRILDEAPAGELAFQGILRTLVPAFGVRSCALHVLEDHLASSPGLSYTLSTSGTLQALFEFHPWAVRAAHITDFVEDDVDLEQGGERHSVALCFIPLHEHGRLMGQLVFEAPVGFRLEAAQAKLAMVIARQISSAIGALNVAYDLRSVALFEERAAIARELHDSLAQSLSYMKIQTARLQAALSARKPVEEAEAVLGELREGLNSGYRKLRELLTTFRVNLGPGGLQAGLEETMQEIRERSALAVTLDYRMGSCRLSSNEEVHVLHVVREALSNAVRHAEADRVAVSLEYDANRYLTVTIDDDGRGIEFGADRRFHHGMAIMEDRVHSLGGTLVVTARPGGGTRVRFRFTPSWSGSRDLLAEQEGPAVESVSLNQE